MNDFPDPSAAAPPVISILIPVYNRENYIADCLASIGDLGAFPAEVIMVDDGSTDGSVARARAAIEEGGIGDRAVIVTQANGGPGSARNHAASLARGEWLVFLDSDDLWMPWTLEILVRELGGAPADSVLCLFNIQDFARPDDLARHERSDTVLSDYPAFLTAVGAHPRMRYGTCNAAVRRSAFAAMGGFSTALRCAEDTDLFLRLAGPTRIITAPVMAGLRRSGQDSLSGHAPSVVEGFRWMAAENSEGRYPGRVEDRETFLAGACTYSIRMAFASGWPGLAYGLYFRNFFLLLNHKTRRFIWRLPLTPILHYRNPRAYPFRFRPQ